MPNARSYASVAFVKKWVLAAREMGIEPGGFELAPGGIVRFFPKASTLPLDAANDQFDAWDDRL